MADDRINVKIAADIAEFRKGLKDAGGDLDTFARKGKDAEGALGGFGKKTDDVGRGTQTLTERTRAAYGITDTLTQAQARQIRTLESGIVATQLSGRELAVHTALRRANTTADTEAGRTITLLAQRHHDLTQASQLSAKATVAGAAATGLARHEAINLSRQLQDIVVSLGSGQSLGMVAMQQGAQIGDIFASSQASAKGLFDQIVSGATRILTPTNIAIGAVTLLGGATIAAAANYQSSQVEIQRNLSGIGRASQLSVADINKVASEVRSLTGISTSQAREAAATYAGTGKIYGETVKAATAVTHDLSKTLGVSFDEASKILAKGLTGGLAGVDQLNERIGFLNGTQRDYLRTLDASVNKQQFQNEVLRLLAPNLTRATELTTLLGKAANVTGNLVSETWDAMGEHPGAAPSADIAALTKQIATLEEQRALLAESGPLTGLMAGISGRVKDEGIEQLTSRIGELRLEMTRLEANDLTAKFGPMNIAAGQLADTFLKSATNARTLADALRALQEAQNNPVNTPEQTERLKTATNEVKVQLLFAKEAEEADGRRNAKILEIAASYKGVGVSTALALEAQKDQLTVASAATGQQRMAAAEVQNYNQLLLQGKTIEEASRLAAGQRAIAQAQINSQAQAQLFSLQDQFAVASAVTGVDRMRAQEQATISQLVRDGVDPAIAASIAAQQHANALAQVNSQAQATLLSMQNQRGVAEAMTGADQIRAQAQATYNTLVQQGVDKKLAAAIATEQEEQATARVTAQIENQIHALEQSTELIIARQNGTEATVKAEQAYENAIRAGADAATAAALQTATLSNERAKANEKAAREMEREAAAVAKARAEMEAYLEKAKFIPFATGRSPGGYVLGKNVFEGTNGFTQFNPQGYKSKVQMPAGMFANEAYGPGGFTAQEGPTPWTGRIIPNPQGYEYQVDKLFNAHDPLSLTSQIDRLLNRRGGFDVGGFGPPMFDQALGQTLARLTDLLPDADKIGAIERELSVLREARPTLARDELIKQLTDQLKQLKEATDANTDAMTLRLDPLFSEGHDYIDKLRIGYYKAASGLTGVVGGSGTGDKVPVHMLLSPGERLQVDPAGAWGKNDFWRQTGGVSNDNSRSTTIINNNSINIRANESPQSRYVKRQLQQGFGRAISAAA